MKGTNHGSLGGEKGRAPMTSKTFRRKMSYQKHLKSVLEGLADNQRKMPPEQWTREMLETMHAETNSLRAREGLPPIPITTIETAQRRATGHDYKSKFPLNLAEIAVGYE